MYVICYLFSNTYSGDDTLEHLLLLKQRVKFCFDHYPDIAKDREVKKRKRKDYTQQQDPIKQATYIKKRH